MAPLTTLRVLERAEDGAREAVSTLRNIDGSVKGRLHFDGHPQSEYIKNYMGLGPAIAVSWEVRGLAPHAEFELYIRDIAGSEEGLVLTPARTLLHLNYFVLCDGESSFSHYAKTGSESLTTQSVLKADADGIARGISIERGMQIRDILGRLVVLKVRRKEPESRVDEVETKGKGRPVFGLIGCHSPME